jgi:hypothetical protein
VLKFNHRSRQAILLTWYSRMAVSGKSGRPVGFGLRSSASISLPPLNKQRKSFQNNLLDMCSMFPDPSLDRWMALINARAGERPVLEIGCGYGDDTAGLATAGSVDTATL